MINFSSGEVGHGKNEFTKRVGFSVAMPSANISINIKNTQESDSGRYVCNVIIHGGPGISGEVRLNVKGNKPQQEFQRLDLIRKKCYDTAHTLPQDFEIQTLNILYFKGFCTGPICYKSYFYVSRNCPNTIHLLLRGFSGLRSHYVIFQQQMESAGDKTLNFMQYGYCP